MNIPNGLICMFSGNTIPDGWLICDGKNNTPNLVDKFILGGGLNDVNGKNNVALAGDKNNRSLVKTTDIIDVDIDVTIKGHQLSIAEMPAHHHEYHGFGGFGSNIANGNYYHQGVGLSTNDAGGGEAHSHESEITSHGHSHHLDTILPYYILCFIIYRA